MSSGQEQKSPITCSYAHWGGFPATIAELDDFVTARSSDAALQALFGKLDLLDSCDRTLNGVISAMRQCRFEATEVARINSQLLDGLWKAVTGRDPDGKAPFAVTVVTPAHFVFRLVCPRFYEATFRWFVNSTHFYPENASWYKEALICAAGTGQAALVEQLLPMFEENGPFAFHVATAFDRSVILGHLSVVKLLLSHCMSPVTGAGLGWQLKSAAEFGRLDVLQWLVSSSNEPPTVGTIRDVLFFAARGAHLNVLKYVLATFPSLVPASSCRDALFASLNTGRRDIVQLLADGAAAEDRPLVRADDLSQLIRNKSLQALALALPYLNFNNEHLAPWRSIISCAACESGSLEIVRMLAQAGALTAELLNAECLLKAVQSCSVDVVAYVIELGGPGVWHDQALACAAAIGNEQIISSLLALLERVSVLRAGEMRRILGAEGCVGILKTLIDFSQKRQLDPVFVLAASHGHVPAVEFLLPSVLDTSLSLCYDGISRALTARQFVVAQLLLQSLKQERQPMHPILLFEGVVSGDTATVELLCSLWADIQERKEAEMSAPFAAFKEAAFRGLHHLCVLLFPLLKADQDSLTEAFTSMFETAIAIAAEDSGVLLVQFVLEHASLSSGWEGPNALDLGLSSAAAAGQVKIASFLLDAGANVHVNRNDPVDVALQHGHQAVLDLLVARGARLPHSDPALGMQS